MAEKREAFIHSVPWDSKCPNPPPKPSLSEWRVLDFPLRSYNYSRILPCSRGEKW
jgi:hypothetical protein